MENHERVERELLKQYDQVVTLVFRMAATSSSKNFVASAPHRWTQTIHGGEDRTTRRCKVAIGETCRAH